MATKTTETQTVTPEEIVAQVLEKAQEKVDEMLAEAEKKAQGIIEDAEAKVKEMSAHDSPSSAGPTKEEIEASKVKVRLSCLKTVICTKMMYMLR